VSTIQDSFSRQQFIMITSIILQSLRIACNFTVAVDCPPFSFSSCLSVVDCRDIVLNSCS